MFSNSNSNKISSPTDEFVVHTMSKDLEEIIHGPQKSFLHEESSSVKQALHTPTSSPFLDSSNIPAHSSIDKVSSSLAVNPSHTDKFAQNPFSVADDIDSSQTEKAPTKQTPQTNHIQTDYAEPNTRSSFSFVFFILIVLILGGGSYFIYFKNISLINIAKIFNQTTTNQITANTSPANSNTQTNNNPTNAIENTSSSNQKPSQTIQSKFSTEKPNYLPLNISTATPQDIKDVLQKTSQEVFQENAQVPVEFVVTDDLNTPVISKKFFEKAGINLSNEFLSNLADSFSLFMYNDRGSAKIGILLTLKDQTIAKTVLQKEESTIVTRLSPLYLDTPYQVSDVVFKDGTYKDAPVRYFNINQSAGLSVDYILSKDKLVIGTSRKTAMSIFDTIH